MRASLAQIDTEMAEKYAAALCGKLPLEDMPQMCQHHSLANGQH